MKEYVEVELQFQMFFTSALDGGEWSALRPGPGPPPPYALNGTVGGPQYMSWSF
jgi:hypothetical protein